MKPDQLFSPYMWCLILCCMILSLPLIFNQTSEAFIDFQMASKILGSSDPSAANSVGVNMTSDVSFDSSGNLWVVDQANSRILKYDAPFSTDQAASLVIGQPNLSLGITNNGGISANSLNFPHKVKFDSSGNLWIIDQGNNRILKYDAPFSTGQAASLVIGQTDFVSGAAGTTATTLNFPTDVAFDPSGNIWITDTGNNRILKYDAPFSTGQTASLVIGQTDFVSGAAGTTATTLNFPHSITFDASGNFWISDADNNRILKYDAPFSTGQAASLVIGQTDFVSGAAGTTATTLNFPTDVAFDPSGDLLASDGHNNRILLYSNPISLGEAASKVIGQSNFNSLAFGTTSTTQNFPHAIDFDPSGNLWVADQNNNRVLRYSTPFSTGQAASLVIGQPNLTSGDANNQPLTSTSLYYPKDVTFDSNGNLWVADYANNRILRYTAPFSTGQAASLVIGQTNFVSNTFATTATTLYSPFALTFDPSGNLWVVDASNNRILRYTAPFSTGQAASLVIGQTNFVSNTFATNATHLNFPTSAAFDSSGNLWVVDYLNHRILRYTAPFSTGQAASLVIGQTDFVSNTFATTATNLNFPDYLAFDSSGNLWVTDSGNNRILKYTSPFSTGQAASLVIGQTDFVSGTSGITSSTLSSPSGITFDSSGNLWTSDEGNNRALRYATPLATGMGASLVIGQPNLSSNLANNGGLSLDTLFFPRGIKLDSSGNLWVADPHNKRVLIFNNEPPSTNVFETNPLSNGINNIVLGNVTVKFSASGSWDKTKFNIKETVANPTGSSPAGTVVGKFYEMITNSPDILSLRNVTFSYTPSAITGLDESLLKVNRFSGGSWTQLSTLVNQSNHYANATTPGFSTFVLSGFTSTITNLSENVGLSDSIFSIHAGAGPTIDSVTATDANHDGVFSNNDEIIVRFSTVTNEPFSSLTNNHLAKSDVDSLFSYGTSVLGSNYAASYLNPSTLLITIIDSTSGNPTPGVTTFTVKPGAHLRNAQNTTLESTPSAILSGSFTSKTGPFITDFVADDPDNSNPAFSNLDNLTIRFSESTDAPGGTTVQNKTQVDKLFSFSQSLGSNYTGQWLNKRTFVVTARDVSSNGNPQIGITIVQPSGIIPIRNEVEDSQPSSQISPPLSGSFGLFTDIQTVGQSGSAVTTLPSGIIASIQLPTQNIGTITFQEASATSSSTIGGTISFIGKLVDITPSNGASCSTQCEISFTYTTDDLPAGIDPSAVKVFHDANNDGDFDDVGEQLPTTITEAPQGVFTAKANSSFNSKFAIGGVVSLQFLLGGGGGGGSSFASFSAQNFLGNSSLSPNIRQFILSEDSFIPLKPLNDSSIPYYPISIDRAGFLVAKYANTIETVTERVGIPFTLQLISPDTSISHMELYMNIEGVAKEIQDSDTKITYDKNKPLEISDPHGFFHDVKITTTTNNNRLKFDVIFTFAQPISKSNIIIRDWNEIMHTSEQKLVDIIEVKSDNNIQTSQNITDQTISENISVIQPNENNLLNYIKEWGGYSSTSISDSELLEHFGINANHIPSWFMKTSKWVVDGYINQQDFGKAINYMYQHGVIK